MSGVKKMIKHRLDELAYLELLKENGGSIPEATTSLSLRVPTEIARKIDFISNKLEISRSDLIRSFLEVSVSEALQELDVDPNEILNL